MLSTPFYDDVHRWTFDRKGTFVRQAGTVDAHLLNYRRLIRGAHRFSIQDDMLALIVQLSNTPDLDQFNYWSLLARLPYDVMWIEWDQHERLRISHRLGKLTAPFDPTEVSQQSGMLLWRDLTHSSRWCANMFARMHDGEVLVNPVVMAYDPEGTDHSNGDMIAFGAGSSPPLSEQLGLQKHLEYILLGYATHDDNHRLAHTAPLWSINKVGASAEPMWAQFRQRKLAQLGNSRSVQQAVNEPFVEQVVENRGILRSVIVLLSMLNNVPFVREDVRPREGHKFSGANRVPYLGHSVVHLKLPKVRQLEYIQQKLRLGYGRLRRHDVRGFYRRTKSDGSSIRCHHIPSASSTSEHITCGRCGHSIRWVNEYQRGDERLGWVQKQYRLGVQV